MNRTHTLAWKTSLKLKHTAKPSPRKNDIIAPHYVHEQCSISIFDAAAAAVGSVALLERLRQAGADLFAITEDGSNALHAAAAAASIDAVRYLLLMGLKPTECNNLGRTPVQEAARAGDWETMSVLLPWETDNSSDASLLGFFLVKSGNLHAIRGFIRHYGQHVIDQGREPLLHVAVNMQRLAVLRLLLEHEDLKINEKDPYGKAVIHHATQVGNTDILHLLLAYPGIDVNAPNKSNLSARTKPLFIAIRLGHEGAIRMLLAHERIAFYGGHLWPRDEFQHCLVHRQYRIGQIIFGDARVQKNDSFDPLLRAIMQGQEDEVIHLLQDFLPNSKIPYLCWAIVFGRTAIAKRLLDSSADYVNYSSVGVSPVVVAAATGDSSFLQSILDHPRFNIYGYGSPVYEAVRMGQLRTLQVLLSHDIVDPNKSQPLIEATKRNNPEMVKMLLSCPLTDVNQREDEWSDTALVGAVRRKNLEIIWLLLKHKGHPRVDINAGTHPFNSTTVLDIATLYKATEIVEILRSFGAKTIGELRQTQQSQDTVEVTSMSSNELGHYQGFPDVTEGVLPPYNDLLQSTGPLLEEITMTKTKSLGTRLLFPLYFNDSNRVCCA